MDVINAVMAWLAAGGWVFIPVWYLAMSLVAFVAYWLDKSAAVHGDWRIKESTLHMFEVLGGWPGAWLAQRTLHHKNRKISYQSEFFLAKVINLGVLAYIIYRLLFVEQSVVWEPSRLLSWITPRSEMEGPRSAQEGVKGKLPRGTVSIRLSH